MSDTQLTMITNDFGTKIWKLNGRYHRSDGPAIEYEDGAREWRLKWWLNGKLHRTDGPAIEHADGHREWWLNDKRYSFDNWLDVNNYLTDQEKLMIKLVYG